MRATFAISSLAEMESFAESLAKKVGKCDVILLNGPLGAGKTFLAQSLIKALGIAEPVTSPTFVIARSYKSEPPLIHMDAYRLLAGANPLFELEDLDLDADQAITVIEWGGELVEKISNQYLEIHINRDSDIREVSIVGHGPRWQGFSI